MWWNEPGFWEAKYNGFIMDFNIINQIYKNKATTLDVFFTAHNIFSGSSYNDILYKNPRQWVEAGIRYTF
jgi:vitamin B12 transporter